MVEDLIKRLRGVGPVLTLAHQAADALEAENARVAELEEAIRKQANAARSLADATIRDASIRQGLAEKAYAESSPEVLASERQANAMLTEENERLTARLTALESERDALLAAAGKEAVAEVVGSQEICWVRVTSNGLKPGDKLYTAPAAALENGDGRDAWQPIETAPKDGTPLMLFARSIHATASIPMFGWFLDGYGWIAQSFHRIDRIVPSHWMPRPEFPADLSQKAGEHDAT
jgi:hypothetical protein